MFPIDENDAYRKGDGSLTTMGEAIGSGGSGELPIASTSTLGGVKIGDGINVNEDGVISVSGGSGGGGGLYYKDFSGFSWSSSQIGETGLYRCTLAGNTGDQMQIDGYTAISCIPLDNSSGYFYIGGLHKWNNGKMIPCVITNRNITNFGIRIYYAKNDELNVIE